MAAPSLAQAEIYKSHTVCDEKRIAIELDYPVFNGSFSDTFLGAALDTTKWYSVVPSWGAITVAGGVCTLSVTDPAGGISPPWMQSRHNLAFPISRDTDWVFDLRCKFPTPQGFGTFIRLCGRSFRDTEAVWGLHAGGGFWPWSHVEIYAPDGFSVNDEIWSTAGADVWRRYRVTYIANTQIYTCEIDQDDDGVYENVRYVPVAGRYVDCIVIGNSTAIQGALGWWTGITVDNVSVTGIAEPVVDPDWASPFTYDSTRFSYLPSVLAGRVNVDIENVVDAAEVTLANQGLAEDLSDNWQQYTDFRFWNRRAIIEMRAGDGEGNWTPWEVRGDMLCMEKQVRLEQGGRCSLTLPMRDRYRAQADDKLVTGCYSDAGAAIPGVGMNMTVAQVVADIYGVKCGLPAAAYNLVATPNNKPRTRNFFRQAGQQAVRTLAHDEAAFALWALRTNAQIQMAEYPWGSGAASYFMSTADEILTVEWTESAFDATAGQQLTFSNTNLGGIIFQCTWPPQRESFYGPVDQADATVCQASADHDARPVNCLLWWMKNRKLGSITIRALAQYWADIGDEIEIIDSRFLGLRDIYILDGMEITWQGNETGICMMRFINPHPDEFLRKNLMA